MNSIGVEFEDAWQCVTSRYAVRRIKSPAEKQIEDTTDWNDPSAY